VFRGQAKSVVDNALVTEEMWRYGLRSKRAAVDLALRRLVGKTVSEPG